jgi:hypothetical protein
MTFHQRFRNKLNLVGKQGQIELKIGTEVTMPPFIKIHNPIQLSAHGIIKEKEKKEYPHDNLFKPKPKTVDYTPYTLRDYREIKPKAYYQLGGLGPYNLGSEDWNNKKNLYDKRKQYGQNVNYSNLLKFSDMDQDLNNSSILAPKKTHKFISHRRYASSLN